MSWVPWYAWATLGVVCIFLPGWRGCFREIVRDMEPETLGDFVCTAGFAAAMFPIGFCFLIRDWPIWRRDARPLVRTVAGESRQQKEARRVVELQARDQRIADLERELGIK